jgi:hypothetical protein
MVFKKRPVVNFPKFVANFTIFIGNYNIPKNNPYYDMVTMQVKRTALIDKNSFHVVE